MEQLGAAAMGSFRSVIDATVLRPAAWLWRCCVRRHGYRLPPQLAEALASSRATELSLSLLTMSVYGATHYIRWSNLATAVGVRIGRRNKALVAGSYMLLPNLLVFTDVDVRCLHLVLISIVTFNNLYLYREFCIMEQLHVYGQRLPGEPVLVGMFQAANVLHDTLGEPVRALHRRLRRHYPSLLTPCRLKLA